MVHTGASLFFDLNVTHSSEQSETSNGLNQNERPLEQGIDAGTATRSGVAVAQIVNFDVANEITILGVDIGVQATGGRRLGSSGRRAFSLRMTGQRVDGIDVGGRLVLAYRTNRGDVDMLDALASLNLSIDLGGGGSCSCSSISWSRTVCARDGTAVSERTAQKMPVRVRAEVAVSTTSLTSLFYCLRNTISLS
ncbi:hypothetical protein KCU93_g18, partial [Aureobasidium melanogenum]